MSWFRWCAVTAVALTGCASAGKPSFGHRPDGGIVLVDGNGGGGRDSSGGGTDSGGGMIDAPMQGGTQTLTQTTDNTDSQVGLACGGTGYTALNSYYRVFALSDYGITGTFHVSSVDFVISGAAKSPPLKVSVGTYSGTAGGDTLTEADITLVASQTITPADTTTAVPQDVPLTADIPAGNLIVEIDQTTAGDSTNGYTFYPGANGNGETKPGYIKAADCGVSTPSNMTQAAMANGLGESDLVLTVTGST